MSRPFPIAPASEAALDQMMAAVALEIAAVQRKSRADSVIITDGVRIAQAGPGATYRFTCDSRRRPAVEDRVTAQVDGTKVEGTVVLVGRRRLTLSLDADLGPTVARGFLTIDTTFLWTALQTRLAELRAAPDNLKTQHVDVLTGRRAPTVARSVVAGSVTNLALNPEQLLAYRQALASDVTFVWGPPGTGKTVVCERIVADGYYHAGLSTLLTAPTNKAADLVLARVLARLGDNGVLDAALARGDIVRVGPISDRALTHRYGDAISLDAIVAARTVQLNEEHARLTEQETQAMAELATLESPRPDNAEVAGYVDGAISAAALSRTIAEVRDALGRLDARRRSLRETVLQNARIVVTTLHRAYLPRQVERMFDAVVIDEGGCATLPAACCAAARGGSHVVVLGDFRQLGPIVTAQHPLVDEWIARDPFHASGVVAALERGSATPGLVALRVQHRSAPAIAALGNAVTYRHAPVETHPSVRARAPLPSPWGTEALMLVDTSALESFVDRSTHGASRSNPVHASIVRWLVKELIAGDGPPGAAHDPADIAVLAPFRGQLELLRQNMPDSLSSQHVEISTVHRYQGDECATTIFDLVDTRGLASLSEFFTATALSDAGSRLVNVAASRARERLIVVADVRYLLRHTPRGVLWEFVEHVATHAKRIELPLPLAHRALTYVGTRQRPRGFGGPARGGTKRSA